MNMPPLVWEVFVSQRGRFLSSEELRLLACCLLTLFSWHLLLHRVSLHGLGERNSLVLHSKAVVMVYP